MEEPRYEVEYVEDGQRKRSRAALNTFIGAKRQAKALLASGKKKVKVRYIDDDGELVHEWDADKKEFHRESRLSKNALLEILNWANGKSAEQKDKFANELLKLIARTRSDVKISGKDMRDAITAYDKRRG